MHIAGITHGQIADPFDIATIHISIPKPTRKEI